MPSWTLGTPIDQPGIYPSIPLPIYHGDLCAGHSASHTGLDRIFMKSPKHYWDKCPTNPDRAEDSPTDSMTLGRAAHHLFMGEREFSKHFVRRPDTLLGEKWNSNRTTCRNWVKQSEARGLTILTADQIAKVVGMGRSLNQEPAIVAGLLRGKAEQSFIWQDTETGIWLKARPDIIPNSSGDFVDLKCVADVRDDAIQRSIAAYGYHRQGALVCEGAAMLTGQPLNFAGAGEDGFTFTLVFVEGDRPHCVEIVTLKPADLKRGYDENHAALRLLKHCLDYDTWPGPSGHQADGRYLGLRPWDIDASDYRIKQIAATLAIGGSNAAP